MGEFGLQIVQPLLGLLALGQVAHKAGKGAPLMPFRLGDREFHGKGRAIPPQPDHHPAAADDPLFPGRQIARQILVMLLPIRRGHQHADILSRHLLRAIAEQPLGGGAERLHDAAVIDHDHGIGNAVEDGTQLGLTRAKCRLGTLGGGDIARHLRPPEQPPGFIPKRRYAQRNIDDLAILAPPPRFEMLNPLPLANAFKHFPRVVPLSFRDQHGNRPPDHLRRAISRKSPPPRHSNP